MDKTVAFTVFDKIRSRGFIPIFPDVIAIVIGNVNNWLVGFDITTNGDRLVIGKSRSDGGLRKTDVIALTGRSFEFRWHSIPSSGSTSAFRAETDSNRDWICQFFSTFFTICSFSHGCTSALVAKNIFPGDGCFQLEEGFFRFDFVPALCANKNCLAGIVYVTGFEANAAGCMDNDMGMRTFCGLHRKILLLLIVADDMAISLGEGEPGGMGSVLTGEKETICEDIQHFYQFAFVGKGGIAVCDGGDNFCLHGLLDELGLWVGDAGDFFDRDERIWGIEDASMQSLDRDFDDVVVVPAIYLSNLFHLGDCFGGESGLVSDFLSHKMSFLCYLFLTYCKIYLTLYTLINGCQVFLTSC